MEHRRTDTVTVPNTCGTVIVYCVCGWSHGALSHGDAITLLDYHVRQATDDWSRDPMFG